MFRNEKVKILVATDVASRGLDIKAVDIVVNFDIPRDYKDYIHRIGRAARGGKRGMSISFISEYDVNLIKNIESKTKTKMVIFPSDEEEVMLDVGRIEKAKRNIELNMFEKGDDEMFAKKKRMKMEFREMVMGKKDGEKNEGKGNGEKKIREKKLKVE